MSYGVYPGNMQILRCACGAAQRLRCFVEKSFGLLRRCLYSGSDFFFTQPSAGTCLPIRFAKAGSIHTHFTLLRSDLTGRGSMQWATNSATQSRIAANGFSVPGWQNTFLRTPARV